MRTNCYFAAFDQNSDIAIRFIDPDLVKGCTFGVFCLIMLVCSDISVIFLRLSGSIISIQYHNLDSQKTYIWVHLSVFHCLAVYDDCYCVYDDCHCVCVEHRSLRSLLLSGNKRDWIETLTQCAEWFIFAVDYFFCITMTLWHKVTKNIALETKLRQKRQLANGL